MVLGIMKRILLGISLLATTFLAACGHSDRFVLLNPQVNPAAPQFSMSDIPYYEKPKFINVPADERLSGVEISLLLRGQTVISRSVDEAAAMQYSFFKRDGLLAINPRPDRLVLGRWRIERDQLCYELERCARSSSSATRSSNGRPHCPSCSPTSTFTRISPKSRCANSSTIEAV